MTPDALPPAAVVAAARRWIGTPYRHQASCLGAGADCLGVVRGVWRDLIGPEPEAPPPYARDWAEDGAGELMLAAAGRALLRAPDGVIGAGDVLLFRVAGGAVAKHCGIATGPAAMVHAYDGHAVAETPIPDLWIRRLVARFRFPASPPPPCGEGSGAAPDRAQPPTALDAEPLRLVLNQPRPGPSPQGGRAGLRDGVI